MEDLVQPRLSISVGWLFTNSLLLVVFVLIMVIHSLFNDGGGMVVILVVTNDLSLWFPFQFGFLDRFTREKTTSHIAWRE